MSTEENEDYGIGETGTAKLIAAPPLPYLPRDPQSYHPAIGLIGCGGISEMHLRAYREAGYRVTALCSRSEERVRQRQEEFFPEAQTYLDYRELLERSDVEVVDITTHPQERVEIIAAALEAGKHVLSQKPFVIDLDVGQRLVEMADAQGLRLAVNQNGRFAPHFSYVRQAIEAELLGKVISVDFAVHWDHNWVAGSPFDEMQPLILYDFGIHWFDMITLFMGERQPRRVFAAAVRSSGQQARPPLLAQAIVEYDDAQAALIFNGDTRHGQEDRTYVVGTKGAIGSCGVDLTEQEVTLHTAEGIAQPALEGTWFRQGFHGAMAELLCAIEEEREPGNGARDNLRSLALCFAAVASAGCGEPVVPGTVRGVDV